VLNHQKFEIDRRIMTFSITNFILKISITAENNVKLHCACEVHWQVMEP